MTEADIIKKCKKGSREAFNKLVSEYQTKIFNMSYNMLSNREDAFDAAQEVFLRVYKNIGSFREQSSFSTWIYRICTNVCTDMLRKRQRSQGVISISSSSYDDEDKDMDIPDLSPTPEEYTELNERQTAVREGLRLLKDEYRTIITLYDIEGLSYEEIANVLQLPIGTVKSRLNRARMSLRKILSKNMELFT